MSGEISRAQKYEQVFVHTQLLLDRIKFLQQAVKMISKRVMNTRKKNLQNRVKKKEVDGPSTTMWINGQELVPGKDCDFCEKRVAYFHCPSDTAAPSRICRARERERGS